MTREDLLKHDEILKKVISEDTGLKELIEGYDKQSPVINTDPFLSHIMEYIKDTEYKKVLFNIDVVETPVIKRIIDVYIPLLEAICSIGGRRYTREQYTLALIIIRATHRHKTAVYIKAAKDLMKDNDLTDDVRQLLSETESMLAEFAMGDIEPFLMLLLLDEFKPCGKEDLFLGLERAVKALDIIEGTNRHENLRGNEIINDIISFILTYCVRTG